MKSLQYIPIIQPTMPVGRQVYQSANCCMNIQQEQGMLMKKKKCCEKFKKKGKRCKGCPGRVD